MDKDNVLVHSCCAICAGYPLEMLKESYSPIAYFCNPNLFPQSEFDKRLDAMKTLCSVNSTPLIVDEYDPLFYEEQMTDFKHHKEGSQRCTKCFEIRLRKTCEYAKSNNIQYFTTTLSISPHKNFDTIKLIADSLAKEYGLTFLDFNFKKKDGFLKTTKIAKELNLYRQNYCGCKNSLPQV